MSSRGYGARAAWVTELGAWHPRCWPMGMAARGRRRWVLLPAWLLVTLGVLAAGLYFGYRWPEVTATVVLFSLVAIWMGAERLTTRWW